MVLPLAWPFLFIILYNTADGTSGAWLWDSILAALAYTAFPVWFFITDGGITYILLGIALYLLRGRRGMQAAAYVALTMLFYFVLPCGQLSALPDFQLSQMFTQYYEWYGAFAVIPMLLYNGQRGRGLKQLFYVFYPGPCISAVRPVLGRDALDGLSKEGFLWPICWSLTTTPTCARCCARPWSATATPLPPCRGARW